MRNQICLQKKSNKIKLDKGYDATMNVINEARAKSPKTRDEATNKAADFIAKAKRDAEQVVSSDETDSVYFSNEELFEQMKQKADSLRQENETDGESDDLKAEDHENRKRKNEAENGS